MLWLKEPSMPQRITIDNFFWQMSKHAYETRDLTQLNPGNKYSQ